MELLILLAFALAMASRKQGGVVPDVDPAELPKAQARGGSGGGARRRGAPDVSGLRGFEPMEAGEVVVRTLAQLNRGRYRLGGGARYTADDVFADEGNRYPGTTDCTGLLAFAAMYVRGQYNTDGIVADAKGARRRFRLVAHDEVVRPGDFLITGRGPDGPDHAGVVVRVKGHRRAGNPQWWLDYSVAHARGETWQKPNAAEEREQDHGAVRVTNARPWRKTGYFIRPLHVTD